MWQIVIQCWSHRKLASKMFPDFWQSWPRSSIKIRHINSFALCLSLASCLLASVWASRPHFLCLWHTPCAELHSAFFWPLHPAARVLYNNKCNSFNSFSLFKVPDTWMYVMVHWIIAFFSGLLFFPRRSALQWGWLGLQGRRFCCSETDNKTSDWSNKFTISQCNTDLHQSIYLNWNNQKLSSYIEHSLAVDPDRHDHIPQIPFRSQTHPPQNWSHQFYRVFAEVWMASECPPAVSYRCSPSLISKII